jgi:hypothetical protein
LSLVEAMAASNVRMREVFAGCQDGSFRGRECDNAEMAVKRADAKVRSKRLICDGKAYTPR